MKLFVEAKFNQAARRKDFDSRLERRLQGWSELGRQNVVGGQALQRPRVDQHH